MPPGGGAGDGHRAGVVAVALGGGEGGVGFGAAGGCQDGLRCGRVVAPPVVGALNDAVQGALAHVEQPGV